MSDKALNIPAWYYRHFDADYHRDPPELGFGGWRQQTLEFSRAHTAVVVMHTWDTRTPQDYPGWWRCGPFIPRANAILRDVFPPLLKAIRQNGLTLFHVVGGGDYWHRYPGYQRTLKLNAPAPQEFPKVSADPYHTALRQFKRKSVFVGLHNEADVAQGFAHNDFPPQTRPLDHEGIAENGPQLFALCQEEGINHLVYAGFAINWCLLLSPGGMHDMSQYGLMCSALRQAVTAVENKESAPNQGAKEIALWRTALEFGFVFDVPDFQNALKS